MFLFDRNKDVSLYESLIFDLIFGFFKLLKFDDDVFIQLNTKKIKEVDKNQDYKKTDEYRDNLGIFFSDVSKYLTFTNFYDKILFPQISSAVNILKQDVSNITIWSTFEGLIYCFMKISKSIFYLQRHSKKFRYFIFRYII
jgi:hypothetical protein